MVVPGYSTSYSSELTAEVVRLRRIWRLLNGAISEALREGGTGQAGEEPEDDDNVRIHTEHVGRLTDNGEEEIARLRADLERQALLTERATLSSGCSERRRQILNSCLVESDEARDCAWGDTSEVRLSLCGKTAA